MKNYLLIISMLFTISAKSQYWQEDNTLNRGTQFYYANGNLGYSVRTANGGGWAFQLVDGNNVAYQHVAYPTGYTGIFTTNPFAQLTVNGDIGISNASIPMGLMTEVGGTTPLLNMSVNFRESNKNNAYEGAAFRIDTRTENTNLFQWLARPANSGTETVLMTLTNDGFLGIGTVEPTSILTVDGNIKAEEIKIEVANAPDYVFEDAYVLQSLAEVKDYIKKNKHLPEVPPAVEMETNGVSLGEMNMLLLKKIEELTLHIIRQEERIIELENKIE